MCENLATVRLTHVGQDHGPRSLCTPVDAHCRNTLRCCCLFRWWRDVGRRAVIGGGAGSVGANRNSIVWEMQYAHSAREWILASWDRVSRFVDAGPSRMKFPNCVSFVFVGPWVQGFSQAHTRVATRVRNLRIPMRARLGDGWRSIFLLRRSCAGTVASHDNETASDFRSTATLFVPFVKDPPKKTHHLRQHNA